MHPTVKGNEQIKEQTLLCEGCTIQDECKTYAALKRKKRKKKDDISIVSSETVGVWENWKKRKSLPS